MLIKIIAVVWSLTFLQVLASPTSDQGDDPGLYITLNEPKNSTIKGSLLTSFLGRYYYAFRDVPYAMPPVGKRRFKEPEPVEAWKGVYNATESTKMCTQNIYNFTENTKMRTQSTAMITGDEDCLYLNVYTPLNAKNTTKRLPVFFWIHGGGFVIGSGGYDRQNPYYFMDEEIVVVTINYRLGILGKSLHCSAILPFKTIYNPVAARDLRDRWSQNDFLSTEDSEIPANLGLRDQWLALEWTRANIDRFGGDFENIVIGGESAGAASVGYHVLGIEQKQIFSGAFMASGTCMSTWAYQEKPKERALKVARKLDKHFDSTDSASILALLQNVTSESLLGNCSEEQSYVDWVSVLPNDKYGYRPPTDAIDTQVFLLVPILLGFNSEESLCPLSTGNTTGDFWKRAKELDDDPSQILGVLKVGQQNATQLGIELRKLYTNGLFADDIPALVRYMSDYRFVTATTKHARMASHFVPTYLYEFSFKSSTAQNSTVPGINGTCHAEDLRFYWKNAFFPIPEKEWIVTRKFVRIISNFVKYKRPMPIPDRGDPDPLFENATWPGVRPNDIVYMNFGEHFKLERNPRNFSTIEAFLDKHLVQPIYVY